MGDGTKLKAANVKADFEGLPSAVLTRFEADLKECYNWNGEFKKKKRKKREVGEEEGEEEADAGIARLPANLLNWARELLPRIKRSAESGLKRRKRASIKGKRGKGKGKEKSGNSGKSRKKSKGKKSGKGKKKGKKSGKKKKKSTSKSKGGSKSSEKSGGSGLDREVYNQLWCADLAVA